jgi:type IV pilus assembly protein PilW
MKEWRIMEKIGLKGHESGAPIFPRRAVGFSLVELLVAMTIGLVVLGGLYGVFTVQNKTFSKQELIVEMQQNARAAMDMMSREIRMAGYDPRNLNSDSNQTNNFFGVTVNSTQLQIKADLDGGGSIDASSQENIIYAFNSANKKITRNIGAGAQTFAENVDSFTFAYLDGSGNVTSSSADVRQLRITITVRTAKPDPAYAGNGGYRTYALTSVVTLRN